MSKHKQKPGHAGVDPSLEAGPPPFAKRQTDALIIEPYADSKLDGAAGMAAAAVDPRRKLHTEVMRSNANLKPYNQKELDIALSSSKLSSHYSRSYENQSQQFKQQNSQRSIEIAGGHAYSSIVAANSQDRASRRHESKYAKNQPPADSDMRSNQSRFRDQLMDSELIGGISGAAEQQQARSTLDQLVLHQTASNKSLLEKQRRLEELRKPYGQTMMYKYSVNLEGSAGSVGSAADGQMQRPMERQQSHKLQSKNQKSAKNSKMQLAKGTQKSREKTGYILVAQQQEGIEESNDRASGVGWDANLPSHRTLSDHDQSTMQQRQLYMRESGILKLQEAGAGRSQRPGGKPAQDQVSLPQLVMSKYDSSPSIHDPISSHRRRGGPVPHQNITSQNALAPADIPPSEFSVPLPKQLSTIQQLRNQSSAQPAKGQVAASAMPMGQGQHALKGNELANQYERAGNRTSDGFLEERTGALLHNLQKQGLKMGMEMAKYQVKNSTLNLSSITMMKKDQVAVNIRPERSNESAKGKYSLYLGQPYRNRATENSVSKTEARLVKAYRAGAQVKVKQPVYQQLKFEQIKVARQNEWQSGHNDIAPLAQDGRQSIMGRAKPLIGPQYVRWQETESGGETSIKPQNLQQSLGNVQDCMKIIEQSRIEDDQVPHSYDMHPNTKSQKQDRQRPPEIPPAFDSHLSRQRASADGQAGGLRSRHQKLQAQQQKEYDVMKAGARKLQEVSHSAAQARTQAKRAEYGQNQAYGRAQVKSPKGISQKWNERSTGMKRVDEAMQDRNNIESSDQKQTRTDAHRNSNAKDQVMMSIYVKNPRKFINGSKHLQKEPISAVQKKEVGIDDAVHYIKYLKTEETPQRNDEHRQSIQSPTHSTRDKKTLSPTSFANLHCPNIEVPQEDSILHHQDQYYAHLKHLESHDRQNQLSSMSKTLKLSGLNSQMTNQTNHRKTQVASNRLQHRHILNTQIDKPASKFRIQEKSALDQAQRRGSPSRRSTTAQDMAPSHAERTTNQGTANQHIKEVDQSIGASRSIEQAAGAKEADRKSRNHTNNSTLVKIRKFKQPNHLIQTIVNQLDEKSFQLKLQNQQMKPRRSIWVNNGPEGAMYGDHERTAPVAKSSLKTPQAAAAANDLSHIENKFKTPKRIDNGRQSHVGRRSWQRTSPPKKSHVKQNSRESPKKRHPSTNKKQAETALISGQQGRKKMELGDLEELKVLGQGSFGIVKLVRHKKHDAFYALKCLSKLTIQSKKQIQHIQNEKSILQLWKPGDFCCGVHETFQDQTNLYMLMEYLSGGELIRQIRKQIFMSEENTRFYLAEIVLAVEQMHTKGIIYRDLKPQNILIDNDGHVKIIDFGFAKRMKDIRNDRSYTNCGTPGYCAPEVMMADVGHTYKADIWSIGVLICEMIGGFIPFQNKNDAQNPKIIMEKCRNGHLNLPKNMGVNARELVKQLLTDDPVSRLEIEQIKQHPFFRSVNWEEIKQRKMAPPYIPEMTHLHHFNSHNHFNNSFKSVQEAEAHQMTSNKSHGSVKIFETPEKAEKLARIPELPTELQTKHHVISHTEQMKIEHYRTLSDSDEQDNPQEAVQDAPLPQKLQMQEHSRQRPIDREYSQSLNAHESKSYGMSHNGSMKYSATGGTGGPNGSLSFKKQSPSRILGDYQMIMVNKAFQDF